MIYSVSWGTDKIQVWFSFIQHPGDQSWVFIGRTDVEVETLILWPPHVKSWLIGKDPDAGRDWGAGGEGDDRGWDGWMASPTRWAWVWVNSGSWWWTGRPGVLRFMGSQRVRHDWATELNWTELNWTWHLGQCISMFLELNWSRRGIKGRKLCKQKLIG